MSSGDLRRSSLVSRPSSNPRGGGTLARHLRHGGSQAAHFLMFPAVIACTSDEP